MERIRVLFNKSRQRFLRASDRSGQGTLPEGSYIAIDWTDPSVSAQELFIHDGKVEIGRQFHDQWPEDVAPANSTELAGEWLRQRIEQADITTSIAVVSVPRRSVSLRLMELPRVDDGELAAVVALQIESRPELSADGHIFDFLPLPVSEAAVSRYVLLAAVPKTVLEQIDKTLAAANLSVCASGVGELAIASLSSKHDRGLTLNVLANHSKVEFVLTVAGIPVASHSTRMPDENPDLMARSIPSVANRMIAALPDDFANLALSHVNLAGPHAGTLKLAATESCSCPVQSIKTECDDAVRTLALLKSLSGGQTLNFQSPRRPVDPALARRQQCTRYAAGIAILAGLIGYSIHDEKTQLQTQLAQLQASNLQKQELNDRGQATLDAWRYVSDWQTSSVNWADEMQAFSEQLPEPGECYLTRIQLEQPAGTDIPVIRADGLAREPEVAMAFNRKLMSIDGKYELQPHGIEPATRDSAFRSSFRVEAAIQNDPLDMASEKTK